MTAAVVVSDSFRFNYIEIPFLPKTLKLIFKTPNVGQFWVNFGQKWPILNFLKKFKTLFFDSVDQASHKKLANSNLIYIFRLGTQCWARGPTENNLFLYMQKIF